MVNAFSGCPTNNSNKGCPLHYAKGGCPMNICKKEKSALVQTLESNNDAIKDCKLQLRLLSDKFKKRKSSRCDSFNLMSKEKYESKKQALEDKLDALIQENRNLKGLAGADKCPATTTTTNGCC